ncbi:carboxypeptidase-like regulatory domain-containing protein [Chitinophaga sedimenti]|uniref:carboxypeptidase-like regulatory domain-containing protein n=1 Tax=Chitinophaga sedimenti TaxID=2033606 RepID=UPI002006A3D2|nr:carboxypeptidase-like regulatory domain-containing protein [Chitinophaga sedimenti]MCK7557796.1 carboxypeptidase-like regulatory domain-containing protein [Chitinophaga sedimenti]
MKRMTTLYPRLLLCLLLQLCAVAAFSQTRPVTGRVVDSIGQALPGVTIQAKGTTIGTQTQPDGSFAFNVPDNIKVLVFSMVGFRTTEAPITAGGMTVSLKANSSALQDVVIVGYGTQKK